MFTDEQKCNLEKPPVSKERWLVFSIPSPGILLLLFKEFIP